VSTGRGRSRRPSLQEGAIADPYDLFVDGPYDAPTKKLTGLTLTAGDTDGYVYPEVIRTDLYRNRVRLTYLSHLSPNARQVARCRTRIAAWHAQEQRDRNGGPLTNPQRRGLAGIGVLVLFAVTLRM